MNWVQLVSLLSISALFLPALLLVFFRLYENKSLLALSIYCLITALYNLMGEGFWPVPSSVTDTFAATNNYLDAPLLGVVFLLYCRKPQTKKLLIILMSSFVVYELFIFFRFGLKPQSSKYVMGPGVALIFGLGLYFFAKEVKKTLLHGKWLGNTLIAAAVVFAYGCYGLIYFFYYVRQTPFVADVFLLYYITSLIFSLLVSSAFVIIYQRHRRIKEVKLVRKELATFFETK